MGVTSHGLTNHGTSLKRGARLRYAVHDNRGMLLLAQGAEVTERVQSLLHLRGITLNLLASLKVVSGPCLNEEIPVKNRMSIGRRSSCDILLTNERVSGVHCIIEMQAFGVWLEDMASKNGTYVNNEPIRTKVELSDQDTIRVGDTVFTMQITAAFSPDSEEGSQALKAWILAAPGTNPSPTSAYIPTAMDINLDDY